ncbi:MAG TPA: serine/threonine-protein kinase [Solirubrobacterales bacterium]|nr:serine/threonine-protein kinase [Solirubrobacterales bacterium]
MKRRLAGERYELEDRLGHGGMATVYRARDLKLDREVAIKLLADNFAGDEEVRKRFSREARLAARLDHPNVVQVFDVGEDEERPFIVMEHVEGGTLEDRLNRRRRSLERGESLRLLGQLCQGLGHAHTKKLVHRDIKPQNLLLRDSDECLKITDFGIARAAEETTRLTRPGRVIGTDRYMAPEQLADGRITAATDVYACGVVADLLLPQSRSLQLHEIITRCLSENPDERFADANELGEALATVEGNGAVGVVRRIRSQGRTKPLPAGEATADWPVPTDVRSTRTRGGHGRRWLAAGLALAAAAAAAAVVIAIGPGDSGSPSKAKPQRPAVQAPAAVPRSDDPATQARQLADFLRAQSRPQPGAQQP